MKMDLEISASAQFYYMLFYRKMRLIYSHKGVQSRGSQLLMYACHQRRSSENKFNTLSDIIRQNPDLTA